MQVSQPRSSLDSPRPAGGHRPEIPLIERSYGQKGPLAGHLSQGVGAQRGFRC